MRRIVVATFIGALAVAIGYWFALVLPPRIIEMRLKNQVREWAVKALADLELEIPFGEEGVEGRTYSTAEFVTQNWMSKHATKSEAVRRWLEDNNFEVAYWTESPSAWFAEARMEGSPEVLGIVQGFKKIRDADDRDHIKSPEPLEHWGVLTLFFDLPSADTESVGLRRLEHRWQWCFSKHISSEIERWRRFAKGPAQR